jgi:hypothetical protein
MFNFIVVALNTTLYYSSEIKQIIPVDLFKPLYVICQACQEDKENSKEEFDTWVAEFVGMAFVCPMFSRQFDPPSDALLAEARKLLSTVCPQDL